MRYSDSPKAAPRMILKKLTRKLHLKSTLIRIGIPNLKKPLRKSAKLTLVSVIHRREPFMMKGALRRTFPGSISRDTINNIMNSIKTTYLTCSLAEVSINRELDIIISRHRGDRGRGIKNKIILRLSFFNWGPYF